MTSLYIKGDLRGLDAALRSDLKQARIAGVVAMNKAVTQMANQGATKLAQVVKLPRRAVKSRIKVVKGYDRPGRRFAAVVTLNQPFPIDRLAPRELKKGGYSVAGRRFPHAFRTFDKRGTAAQQRLVFQRKGKSRLPIERVGIPIADEAEAVFKPIYAQFLGTKLLELFNHEMRRRVYLKAAQ